MRVFGTIAVAVCAAVVSSQCGSGGAAAAHVADAINPAPAGVTANIAVRVAEYKFIPETVHVAVGQVIRWTNEDNVGHTVTFTNADTVKRPITSRAELMGLNRPKELYSSKLFNQGESWSAKFDKPGKFAYICDPHPYMRAVVIVQ